jgi:hypothetical protein
VGSSTTRSIDHRNLVDGEKSEHRKAVNVIMWVIATFIFGHIIDGLNFCSGGPRLGFIVCGMMVLVSSVMHYCQMQGIADKKCRP